MPPLPPNPGTQANAYTALFDWQNLAKQMWELYGACKSMQQRQAHHGYIDLYNATATYSLNPDGSPDKDDPAPVNTNPMQGTYLSASQVSGFDGYCINDLISFIEGSSVGPADRRPAIQQMLP